MRRTIPVKKTRKQARKLQRKEKKAKKHDYYVNRKKGINNSESSESQICVDANNKQSPPKKQSFKKQSKPISKDDEQRRTQQKEKAAQEKLQKEMANNRKKQLKEANQEEDRNIKFLEKQLKLNKRKSKSIPKSFTEDGLDYLLEVCDSENLKNVVSAEQHMAEINDEFEEDFALMTGKATEKRTKKKTKQTTSSKDSKNVPDEESDLDPSDEESDLEHSEEESALGHSDESDLQEEEDSIEEEEETDEQSMSESSDNSHEDNVGVKKRKLSDKKVEINSKRKKIAKVDPHPKIDDSEDEEGVSDATSEDAEQLNKESGAETSTGKDGEWEDIYGRIRNPDGSIKKEGETKYIPPAIRARMEAEFSADSKKRSEKLSRLRKVLTGLLNRLAESNMHNICNQIEELYMQNSRNDMNDTLTRIVFDSIISPTLSTERLLLEHIMLVTVLHANVGTEVGAHFLQAAVNKFDELSKTNTSVEQKLLDNVVHILAQMYNFKIFHSQLMFQILHELLNRFSEKDVECILLVFKNVGFSLRKDDPLALKNLVLDLQKAAAASEMGNEDARVKYMLDILLAIKNNNMTKIPNYDPTYAERLKKLQKTIVRKGSYVTQLNISLEDLRSAEEKGKWWVVGSAWQGNIPAGGPTKDGANTENVGAGTSMGGYSQKLLDLARKQRMNTDTRRNIFCILMSAEDYIDAFEKLLHLGLKNQQEREIVNVILHCCLSEKRYNPYYAVLTQKFCDHDRKFQITVKYSTWDKLKALTECSGNQISNLAKLLTHLFLEKGLPISTLKIVEFGELDKTTLRFMRQVLLGILLFKEESQCLAVFEKVGLSDKLKMFRQSLRLFMHHFLLKNLDSNVIPDEQKGLLERRVKLVEKLLVANERRSNLH